jgi:anti-anti-sigma factor
MAGEFTLHPQGDIDVATVEQQRGQWLEVVEQRRPQRLVIDMTDVTFLDSTGLGAIVALQRRQRAHGGVVAIANAAPPVQQVLQLTGMHLTMEVNGTAPAATEG